MKIFLLFSAAFVSIFSSSFAADKVYSIEKDMGIVADDAEWVCGVVVDAPGLYEFFGRVIHAWGRSLRSPIHFTFSCGDHMKDKSSSELYLKASARESGVVFRDVETIIDDDDCVVVEGKYLRSGASGYFQVSSKKIGCQRYVMFSMINSALLDDQERDELYNSVRNLITPLYSPKR